MQIQNVASNNFFIISFCERKLTSLLTANSIKILATITSTFKTIAGMATIESAKNSKLKLFLEVSLFLPMIKSTTKTVKISTKKIKTC